MAPISSPPLATHEAADPGWSPPDNRFIPIRACDLTQALASDAARFGLDSDTVAEFANVLKQVIDRETDLFEHKLADTYAKFNPDRETRALGEDCVAKEHEYETLCDLLALLLDKANYEELDDVQIAHAVMRAKTRNLAVRVDPKRVEFLRLWIRGRGETAKRERCRWKPWRQQEVTVPVFKRLVVMTRLKGDCHVILKLFKDIPEAEAEALLPHAEVTMSLWDRLKLLGTGAGTLGVTVSKLLKIAIGFAALWKLAWILLIGAATLGVRAMLGYRNARLNRDWQRTRHLYFQNLGNNASALQLLLAKVKQEEFKEALVGYLFRQLSAAGSTTPVGTTQLCDRIEEYLRERFDVEVDFDMSDADQKLRRLGLCESGDIDRVLPIESAIEVLKQRDHPTTTGQAVLIS